MFRAEHPEHRRWMGNDERRIGVPTTGRPAGLLRRSAAGAANAPSDEFTAFLANNARRVFASRPANDCSFFVRPYSFKIPRADDTEPSARATEGHREEGIPLRKAHLRSGCHPSSCPPFIRPRPPITFAKEQRHEPRPHSFPRGWYVPFWLGAPISLSYCSGRVAATPPAH